MHLPQAISHQQTTVTQFLLHTTLVVWAVFFNPTYICILQFELIYKLKYMDTIFKASKQRKSPATTRTVSLLATCTEQNWKAKPDP